MIIDVHTHIFPKAVCEKREDYFEGEGPFQLLYDSPKARIIDADALIESMDAHGIDKSVTFGFPWKKTEYFKKHNDYILESVNRYPDRLIGLCCADIYSQGAEMETPWLPQNNSCPIRISNSVSCSFQVSWLSLHPSSRHITQHSLLRSLYSCSP